MVIKSDITQKKPKSKAIKPKPQKNTKEDEESPFARSCRERAKIDAAN